MTGMIEGVFWVLPEIKYKTKLVLRLFLLPGNFYGSEIWHGFFGGLNSGPGFFFFVLFFLFEALRVFLGFDPVPPFDHPCHLKSGLHPWVLELSGLKKLAF